MDRGTALGIKILFVMFNAYVMYLGINERTDKVYLVSVYNILFLYL